MCLPILGTQGVIGSKLHTVGLQIYLKKFYHWCFSANFATWQHLPPPDTDHKKTLEKISEFFQDYLKVTASSLIIKLQATVLLCY